MFPPLIRLKTKELREKVQTSPFYPTHLYVHTLYLGGTQQNRLLIKQITDKTETSSLSRVYVYGFRVYV